MGYFGWRDHAADLGLAIFVWLSPWFALLAMYSNREASLSKSDSDIAKNAKPGQSLIQVQDVES